MATIEERLTALEEKADFQEMLHQNMDPETGSFYHLVHDKFIIYLSFIFAATALLLYLRDKKII